MYSWPLTFIYTIFDRHVIKLTNMLIVCPQRSSNSTCSLDLWLHMTYDDDDDDMSCFLHWTEQKMYFPLGRKDFPTSDVLQLEQWKQSGLACQKVPWCWRSLVPGAIFSPHVPHGWIDKKRNRQHIWVETITKHYIWMSSKVCM